MDTTISGINMQTVLSHIIQKRFSRVNEDVATDALAFLLNSSEVVREGMMRLLRRFAPELESLRFETQEAEGQIRPDMWGYSSRGPRVFIENKFWAGLTDNQPVSYLKTLASYDSKTILLVIAPSARENTLWRELRNRLKDSDIRTVSEEDYTGGVRSVRTSLGPTLVLTSWDTVLTSLEHEAVNEPHVRGDLIQLRSLCQAADVDAFNPLSKQDLSDQRIPSLILQLTQTAMTACDQAVTEKVIDTQGLRPMAQWDRAGRYARFAGAAELDPGFWFGVHLNLWKAHGTSPYWLVFSKEDFGRAYDVRRRVEPWAANNNVLTVFDKGEFAVSVVATAEEDKEVVIKKLIESINQIRQLFLPGNEDSD